MYGAWGSGFGVEEKMFEGSGKDPLVMSWATSGLYGDKWASTSHDLQISDSIDIAIGGRTLYGLWYEM